MRWNVLAVAEHDQRPSAAFHRRQFRGDGVIERIAERRTEAEFRETTAAMLEPSERVHQAFAGCCKIAGQAHTIAKVDQARLIARRQHIFQPKNGS